MSRMTVSDRNQLDRAGYVERNRGPRTAGGRRAAVAFTVIGLIVLATLSYAAFQVFDGGHHLIVIADLVIVLFGVAAWLDPNRRNV